MERKPVDSYNEPVQPREQGDETDVKIPDFIVTVVKGAGTLTDDIPLLVVEVKRDDTGDKVEKTQILNYMGALADKIGNVKFKGGLKGIY